MKTLIQNIIRKWFYAFRGLLLVFKEEKSIWAYLFIFCLLCIFAGVLKFSNIEWALMVITSFLVASIEVLNTSIEAAVDAMSFRYDIKVKKIKDIASAATLVITGASIIVNLLLFIPKII